MIEPLRIDGRAASEKYHLGPLSAKLIAASCLSEEQIQELLNHDARLSASEAVCVQKACARILMAKEKSEKVFVAGDYDADGITSTAIMKATLDALHIQNGYYIPDRFKEGYGLKPRIVEMAHAKGYSLIITVDNGVRAHEALIRARQLGMDTIVTDHHIIEEDIESDIVVHPDYMEEPYAFLSGAGVALEISRNLIGNRDDLNAFAGVAAIGDVMPLWRETRKLVLCALDQLKQGKPKSLAALLYPGAMIDDSAIAFTIVPKLNALSRMNNMANVNTMVSYLLCDDPRQIHHYVRQVNMVNDTRKKLSASETKQARTKVNENPFQIIYDPSYHVGICGIVAARIVEETQKPTLVLTDYNDVIKGSGRSVPGFDLFSFLSDIDEKKEFGGHEMACGISIRKEDFSSFCDHVQKKMETFAYTFSEETRNSILIDPDEVNFDNIMDLNRLAPFPKELASPLFTVRHPHITDVQRTSRSVRYQIDNGRGGFEADVFGDKILSLPSFPDEFTGRLTVSRRQNRIVCQMMVDDAK